MVLEVIALVVACVAALMGGGGLLSLAQFKRQVEREDRVENRENRTDIFSSYREQIELAEKDGLMEEVSNLRQEFRNILSGWRDQQDLESLAPREVHPDSPPMSEGEVSRLRDLLASTQGLPPSTVSAEGHRLRGNAFFETEDYESAVDEYSEAIRLDPGFANAYNGRGAALGIQGQHKRAIEDFNEAIRLDPGFTKAYRNRGTAYAMQGQHERAIEDYNEAIGHASLASLDPGVAQAYYNRGTAYGNLHQYDRAIEDYDEAIRLNPEYSNAYNNRGFAYTNLSQHERAIKDCDEAIRLNPELSNAYNNRGTAYRALGKDEEAQADFDRAAELG